MSLTDIMSHMQLTVWPEVALVIFLGVFVLMAWSTFARADRTEHEEASQIPLEDEVYSREVRGEG